MAELIKVRNATWIKSAVQSTPVKTMFQWQLNEGSHHLFIGSNASGKSTFLSALAEIICNQQQQQQQQQQPQNVRFIKPVKHKLVQGDVSIAAGLTIESVSFSQHGKFLTEHGDKVVAHVLGGIRSNEDIIVRFGLYPVWDRRVRTLSTGELRKTMLARALAKKPKILMLDKPFDGLDVPSKKALLALVGDITKGLTPSLVANVPVRDRRGTNIILVTHRREEVPKQMTDVVKFADMEMEWVRPFGNVLMHSLEYREMFQPQKLPPPMPQCLKLQKKSFGSNRCLIHLEDAAIGYDANVLLENLNWTIRESETWVLHGLNGAGKSTLSRMLLGDTSRGERFLNQENSTVLLPEKSKTKIVSTDVHLDLLQHSGDCTVRKLLEAEIDNNNNNNNNDNNNNNNDNNNNNNNDDEDTCRVGLDIEDTSAMLGFSHLLDTKFENLSQGQQKMVVIARAFVGNLPDLVLLDEITQGLDATAVIQVFAFLRGVSKYSNISIVYITHHLDELRYIAPVNRVIKVLYLKNKKATQVFTLGSNGDLIRGDDDEWFSQTTTCSSPATPTYSYNM